jgi:hypothetical protein
MKLQGGSGLGPGEQLLPQLIVGADELANGLRPEPVEEAPQAGLVGHLVQPQQGQEEAIVLQFVALVKPLHPGDQEEEQQFQYTHRIKLRTRRAIIPMPLQPLMQIKLLTKSLNQEQSAIVAQTVGFKRILQCLQTFFHSRKVTKTPLDRLAISSLPVRLLPERKKAESANVPNAFPLIQQKRTHFSG